MNIESRKYVWKMITCYRHALEHCCLKDFSAMMKLFYKAVPVAIEYLKVDSVVKELKFKF